MDSVEVWKNITRVINSKMVCVRGFVSRHNTIVPTPDLWSVNVYATLTQQKISTTSSNDWFYMFGNPGRSKGEQTKTIRHAFIRERVSLYKAQLTTSGYQQGWLNKLTTGKQKQLAATKKNWQQTGIRLFSNKTLHRTKPTSRAYASNCKQTIQRLLTLIWAGKGYEWQRSVSNLSQIIPIRF